MLTEKTEKNRKKYICEKCNFISCDKKDYNKHILTAKHKNNTFVDISFTNLGKKTEKTENIKILSCNCGKQYKSRQGLYAHKKKCNYKENAKQQQQISELIPKIGNTTNNTQNNKFNINVFLNEKCKDALNMSDFIKSIEVSLQQLDFTKQNGLANGLSKTIMDNMNKLSVYERPLHCTDVKRETLYIKEENEWSKDISKEKIKKAIKKASSKNYNALQDWKTENPDFLENDLKQEYFSKTISTIGKTDEVIEEKIIKNLCKETYIKD